MRTALGWIVGFAIFLGLGTLFVQLTGGWFLADSGRYDSEGNEISNGAFLMFGILTVSIWAGMFAGGSKHISTHWVASLTGYFFIVGIFGYMFEHVRVSDAMSWVLLIAEIGLIFGGGYLVFVHCQEKDREIAAQKRLTESHNTVL